MTRPPLFFTGKTFALAMPRTASLVVLMRTPACSKSPHQGVTLDICIRSINRSATLGARELASASMNFSSNIVSLSRVPTPTFWATSGPRLKRQARLRFALNFRLRQHQHEYLVNPKDAVIEDRALLLRDPVLLACNHNKF